jgi:lantibiotic biosynthesis protein
MSSGWVPLLEGALAERVREDVGSLVAELANRVFSDVEGQAWEDLIGIATLLTYAHESFPEPRFVAAASVALEHAVQGALSEPLSIGLFGGLCAVGWALEHLTVAEGNDPNRSIDEALRVWCRDPQSGSCALYDLIDGWVGVGVYALERGEHDAAHDLLGRVVMQLDALARRDIRGVAWYTPPEQLPIWQWSIAPEGYYNLGVAHGMAGVIGLLGRAIGAGVEVDRAQKLLDGAVPWLLETRLGKGSDSRFADWIAPGRVPQPTRTAWCYGDPGIAASLMIAARYTGNEHWAQVALDTSRSVARRAAERTGIEDSGLCHGATGVAHILNRMYQATGDEELGVSAIGWFNRALGLRKSKRGIGGYGVKVDGSERKPNAGFLTGASGVGLAFLAAISSREPAWDRRLLVDIPTQSKLCNKPHGPACHRAPRCASHAAREGAL